MPQLNSPAPFADTDFQSLDDFPMRWRWTEARYNILPPEALKTIHPFTPRMASELWAWSNTFLDMSKAPGEFTLADGVFATVHRLDTSLQNVPSEQWLASRGVTDNPSVIVSWQPEWAVLTQWNVFCQYWDDFCYPSSDDVVVWPLSEEWALLYWHEEELIFGAKAVDKKATP